MSFNPSRLHVLFEKYKNNTCSRAELQEFWQLAAELSDNDQLEGPLQQMWEEARSGSHAAADADGTRVLNRVFQKAREEKDKSGYQPRRWLTAAAAAAAILIILFAGGSVLFFFGENGQKKATAKAVRPLTNDVPPGVTGATLTLANGQKIRLDSTGAGAVSKQAGMDVRFSNHALQYEGTANEGAAVYNTLSTGRGQQFPVQLSDGSKVLLDAGSSLHYPVAFTSGERKVEVSGQAWFEVAKDAARPFIVQKGDKQLQVLGTQFNVHAYDDEEELTVTLTEGSVRVQSSKGSAVLTPGQQAVIVNSTGSLKTIEEAAVDQAIAWKQGLFSFQGSAIEQVMREVTRWYDVEVSYQGTKPADTFTGEISRQASLRELLSILEMSRVHFKLEDRKLTVLNGQGK
ncbi:MAG: FecR domain-containing protein [Williamsia sp.]|nr:FecR domain-containing protein [Williamsia sp.]